MQSLPIVGGGGGEGLSPRLVLAPAGPKARHKASIASKIQSFFMILFLPFK